MRKKRGASLHSIAGDDHAAKDGGTQAVPPVTSACVGCHTHETAKLRMDTMTTSNGRESCVTCYGVRRTFAVDKVHQR